MRTYIKIRIYESKELSALNEKLYEMCESIETETECVSCVPKGGYLVSVLQLLSKHKISYEIKMSDD